MEHKSCPELMFLGFLYMVPLAFSALVAFPNLSLSDFWITGWLFVPGFTGFALFIFGTQMELDEMVLKGLLVVSGVLYGVVGYAGLLSTNTWAAGTAVWVFGAVLLINREKKAVATGLILAAMMFTGWVLALVTGVYNAFVGIPSMALGLLTLVLILVGLDHHRKNVSVLTRVAAVAMVAVLVLVTAFFWMNTLEQVALSMLCGSVAVVLFCYCLISPLVSD